MPFYKHPMFITIQVGVLLGYILHHTRGKTVKVDPVVNLVLWQVFLLPLSKPSLRSPFLLPLQLCMDCMTSGKAKQQPFSCQHPTTPSSALLGALLFLGSFSPAQRWFLSKYQGAAPTYQGHGGPVSAFLSWGLFAPLARLTYCCYLIHMEILSMLTFSALAFFPNDVSQDMAYDV